MLFRSALALTGFASGGNCGGSFFGGGMCGGGSQTCGGGSQSCGCTPTCNSSATTTCGSYTDNVYLNDLGSLVSVTLLPQWAQVVPACCGADLQFCYYIKVDYYDCNNCSRTQYFQCEQCLENVDPCACASSLTLTATNTTCIGS